jgi:hypothetical protein
MPYLVEPVPALPEDAETPHERTARIVVRWRYRVDDEIVHVLQMRAKPADPATPGADAMWEVRRGMEGTTAAPHEAGTQLVELEGPPPDE